MRTQEPTPGRLTVASGEAELLNDADRRSGWLLSVEGVPQSYVDTDDPTYLEFDYVRQMADVLDLAAAPRVPLRVLHVGGAGLCLPRYVAATRPGSRQTVFEPDEALTAFVRRHLPLRRGSGIRVRGVDGRTGVAATPDRSADAVVVDAFTGGHLPVSVCTAEFFADVARVLRPGGTFVQNLADGAPLSFSRRVVAALRTAFTGCAVLAEPAVLRGRRFGNLVVAAGGAPAGSVGPMGLAELARRAASASFPARVVTGEDLARLAGSARPLTDSDPARPPDPPPGTWTL